MFWDSVAWRDMFLFSLQGLIQGSFLVSFLVRLSDNILFYHMINNKFYYESLQGLISGLILSWPEIKTVNVLSFMEDYFIRGQTKFTR
jgi:uncharacterized membrane protein